MAGKNRRERQKQPNRSPRVLVIDIGGTNIKVRVDGSGRVIKIPSGKNMTAEGLATKVKQVTRDWNYDVISIGFPGPVVHGQPAVDPENLGRGWTGCDYGKLFGKPVKLINDAAMQALGCYRGGRMLFVGLGTGLGSALILDEVVVPLELGELRYSKTRILGDALGKRGRDRLGQARWERAVRESVANLKKAFVADHVVIGGGNAKNLKRLPKGARRGSNRFAFRGGLRLWRKAKRAKVREHTLTIA